MRKSTVVRQGHAPNGASCGMPPPLEGTKPPKKGLVGHDSPKHAQVWGAKGSPGNRWAIVGEPPRNRRGTAGEPPGKRRGSAGEPPENANGALAKRNIAPLRAWSSKGRCPHRSLFGRGSRNQHARIWCAKEPPGNLREPLGNRWRAVGEMWANRRRTAESRRGGLDQAHNSPMTTKGVVLGIVHHRGHARSTPLKSAG